MKTWLNSVVGMAVLGLLLNGCGGGGGGGGGAAAAGTSITGSAKAPGGSLKPSGQWIMFMQGAPTLAPVIGANVFAFQIDNSGNPSGSTLASGTTDSSGNFSVTLPGSLASNIVVQITTSSSPVQVGTAGNLNCPAVQPVLNIDPVAELVTRSILQRIAAVSGDLGNFTADEITSFINLISSAASDPTLIGSSLDATLTNINNVVSGLISSTIDGFDDAGAATAPSTFGGTYNYVCLWTEMSGSSSNSNISRGTCSGTAAFDASAKTFTITGQSTDYTFTESFGTDPCARTFTRTTSTSTDNLTGKFLVSGAGQILMTTDATATDSSETFLGSMNPAGTLVVFPIVETNGFGFVVAVQQGSGLTTSSLSGIFNWTDFSTEFPASFTASGTWTSYKAVMETGTISFSSGSYSGSETGGEVGNNVNCTGTGTNCSVSSTLGTITFPSETFSGTVSVSNTGVVTLTDALDPTDVSTGVASSDGNFAIAESSHTESFGGAHAGFVLATRQGSGMTNASVSGAYNFAGIGDSFSSGGGVETGMFTGVMTFNGAGGCTYVGVFNGIQRRDCTGGVAGFTYSSETENFSGTGTYTVSSTGDLTLTLTDTASVNDPNPTPFTINATISADGSVAVFRISETDTANSNGEREIGVAVKQ